MKKKALFVSFAVIAICICIISGATFALFTSESGVNVAVTSAKVELKAVLTAPTVSSSLGQAQGTAEPTPKGVALTNFAPGDKAEFAIELTNNSSIDVQYLVSYEIANDTGLGSGLVVAIDAETDVWSTWEQSAASTKTVAVSVTFPYSDSSIQNFYQTKSCDVNVIVKAVQGNAEVGSVIYASNYANLKEAIAAAKEGSTIVLDGNKNYELPGFTRMPIPDNLTIVGTEGSTVSQMYLNCAVESQSGDDVGQINGLTLKNIKFTGQLYFGQSSSQTLVYTNVNGLTVSHCQFVDGGKMNCYDVGYMIPKYELSNVTIEYCSFNGTVNRSTRGGAINLRGCAGEWNICGNVFTHCDYNAINIDCASGTMTVENNIINGTFDRGLRFAAIGYRDAAQVIVKNNMLLNAERTSESQVCLIGYNEFNKVDGVAQGWYVPANSSVSFSGNTYNGHAWAEGLVITNVTAETPVTNAQ